jgi:hypothetical protein
MEAHFISQPKFQHFFITYLKTKVANSGCHFCIATSIFLRRQCGVLRSRDSVVDIATGYGLDDRGVGVRALVGSRIFLTSFRPVLRPTKPPIQWVPGTLSTEVKRRGHEADHSPPTSAEVKKIWIYTSTPPYAFVAYCLIS